MSHSSTTLPRRPTLAALGKQNIVGSLRQWLAIDQNAKCRIMAGSAGGRLLIAAVCGLSLLPHFSDWEAVLLVVAAMAAAALPDWRNRILFVTTWTAVLLATALGGNDTLENIRSVLHREQINTLPPTLLATGCLILGLLGAFWVIHHVRQAPGSVLARRPLLTLLLIETLLCGLASVDIMQGLPRALIWAAIFTLTPYIWFLPYAIVDQRNKEASPPLLQLATLRPFWSPGYLPFGKGAAFLRKHLAKTPEELAVTQLKAVKLLVWANVLFVMNDALYWLAYEQGKLPAVHTALDAFLSGQPYPIIASWLALIVSATRFALQVATWAHLFIGIARLAGYRLPRGSWRPLESRTLMDYFNRFHFYFKELLVDFFFIPTFFKVFKKHPRLRMFFATFMAAGVGNAIWHFLRDIHLVAQQGLAPALTSYTSYLFYCVVLATGVGLSQVRANLGIRPNDSHLGRLYSFVFVWSFVICLHLFSDGSRQHTLAERLQFFTSLFGIQ